MIRGSPDRFVICPNWLLVLSLFGRPKCVLLNALSMSHRKSRLRPSPKYLKLRVRLISNCPAPGPTIVLRPQLPNRTAGAAKSAVLNQRVTVLSPDDRSPVPRQLPY